MIATARVISTLSSRLPTFISSFVGRETEIATITDIVESGSARLLTLSGPGGVGKTRVAMEVGARLQRRHGWDVSWITFLGVDRPTDVVQVIVDFLGLSPRPNESPAYTLIATIGDRRACMVLDGFDRLIDAATDIVDLLVACPNLTLIVTSRERLRVRGEREVMIEPLEAPPTGLWIAPPTREQAEASPAVRLFVDRARDVTPEFQLSSGNATHVARICSALDGLPLAIEIAAANLRSMSVESLLQRLQQPLTTLSSRARDVPEHQQTLAATIDWSCSLLNDNESTIFRRLAVFRGGFTIEATEAIVGFDMPQHVASMAIEALVDKNLVRLLIDPEGLAEPGLLLLRAVRDFAQERLDRSGEAGDIRRRHAEWYRDALRSLWNLPNIGWVDARDLDRAESNRRNLWHAWRWFAENGEDESRLLTSALTVPMWMGRGMRNVGIEVLRQDLAETRHGSTQASTRAAALFGLGFLERTHGDVERSTACFTASHREYEDAGMPLEAAAALVGLGIIQYTTGRIAESIASLEESVSRLMSLGDQRWLGIAQRDLAMALIWDGNHERARPMLVDALTSFRYQNVPWGSVVCNLALVRSFLMTGDLSSARLVAIDLLGECRALGIAEITIDALLEAAVFVRLQGDRALASALFDAIDIIVQKSGYRLESPQRQWLDLHRQDGSIEQGRILPSDVDELCSLLISRLSVSSTERAHRPASDTFGNLTDREREVLELLSLGLSDREIGDRLSISHRTVMRHVANLLPKLGVSSRTAAAALWLQRASPTSPGCPTT